MSRRTVAPLLLIVVGAVGMVSGCRRDTGGRVEVSGNVTFRGEPLKTGTIEFASKDGSCQSGAAVANGKYALPADKGLKPGEYAVRITSVQEQANAAMGPPGPESMKQTGQDRIPPEYNVKSKLTAEVKQGERNVFGFDLK